MAITRTARGVFNDKTSVADWTVTPSGDIATGSLLVAGISWDGGSSLPVVSAVDYSVDSGSNWLPMTMAVEYISNVYSSTIYYRKNVEASTSGAGRIRVTFGGANSTAHAMFVTEVTNIDTSSPLDITSSGITFFGTSVSDTATSTNQAAEILVGCCTAKGPVEDSSGTWSNSWSAGQRDGTTGGTATSNITSQEGYKILSATESSQAAITGLTSRSLTICHASFKGTSTITGTLSKTEAADTSSAAGVVDVAGALTKTEAADTSTSAGSAPVVADSSLTEGVDTLSATGSVSVPAEGAAAITEAGDTLTSSGINTAAIVADAALTESADTLGATNSSTAGVESEDTVNAEGSASWLKVTPPSDVWTRVVLSG